MKYVLTCYGEEKEKLKLEEVEKMIKLLDPKKEGKIRYSDFVKLLTQNIVKSLWKSLINWER